MVPGQGGVTRPYFKEIKNPVQLGEDHGASEWSWKKMEMKFRGPQCGEKQCVRPGGWWWRWGVGELRVERPWAFSESKYKGRGGVLGTWPQLLLSFQGRNIMEINEKRWRAENL